MANDFSADLTCPLVSSRDCRPGCSCEQLVDEPAPSLHPHYRSFATTTSRSASAPRDGTQSLRFQPRDAPSRHPTDPGSLVVTRLPTFRTGAADRTRAAYMPDTTWPIGGHPPGSSRRLLASPVSMPTSRYDTSTAVRSRSPSRSPPDTSTDAFSSSLTTTVINQRSMRWFDASPRRATPKGHSLHHLHSTASARSPTATSFCVRGTPKITGPRGHGGIPSRGGLRHHRSSRTTLHLRRPMRRKPAHDIGLELADVQAPRDAGLTDSQIFTMTVLVALRIAFASVNDALGVSPDAGLQTSAPEAVLGAVTRGRPMENAASA